MTNEDNMNKTLRIIRALRAKAEGTDNEAEASAFMAKVSELMAQHGLEEAQLDVKEQSGIDHERTAEKSWDASPSRQQLVYALSRLYMVQIVKHPSSEQRWSLIGRKHNIVMVREMAEYLIGTTRRVSNKWGRETGNSGRSVIDFRKGCFDRLRERVDLLRKQQIEAATPQYNARGNPQNLPALYAQENSLVLSERDRIFPRLGKARASSIRMGSAAMHGRQAGDSISLNRQVSSGGRSGAMLIGKC
jgi:Protein of unknown function (DUF2786)